MRRTSFATAVVLFSSVSFGCEDERDVRDAAADDEPATAPRCERECADAFELGHVVEHAEDVVR